MSFFPEHQTTDMFGAAAPPEPAAMARLSLRQRAASFWLQFLFWSVGRVPWLARMTVGFWIWATWVCSASLRHNTMDNARRLLGPAATWGERARLSRAVLRSFFLFVHDVGRHSRMTLEQMRGRVESVAGQEHYEAARALKRGVILATAHFGSFEAGVAALRQREQRVHVVFRRDRFSAFDTVRSRLHEKLGVIESPIDEGIAGWVRIRQALQNDEAVLMQADRVMPGQRGVRVPFFDGEIEVPIGPAKLALMTGAPIVPIFAVRLPTGRVRIEICPAVCVDATAADPLTPAVRQVASIIERYVRLHPNQWLAVHKAWIHDGPST
jgi:KDO2-lipid IV(A) lauroyltransferase